MQDESPIDAALHAGDIANAKRILADLWAGDNKELADALVLAFDEMELEASPKPTVKPVSAQPGWPKIQRGEAVIFKDYWCTVVAFTAKGVELNIGEPTAALRKRVAKTQDDLLKSGRKHLQQEKEIRQLRQRQRKKLKRRRQRKPTEVPA